MDIKHCNKCDTAKPISYFGKRSASKDGLASMCKLCQSEYDKARANLPHRVKGRERYAQTDAGKAARKRAREKYKSVSTKKMTASNRLNNAVRDGHIKKKPCEICGAKKAEAHHDDYAYALDVRWLCAKHHNEWHAEHGEARNAS